VGDIGKPSRMIFGSARGRTAFLRLQTFGPANLLPVRVPRRSTSGNKGGVLGPTLQGTKTHYDKKTWKAKSQTSLLAGAWPGRAPGGNIKRFNSNVQSAVVSVVAHFECLKTNGADHKSHKG
jgi:hypothetical protein